MEQSRKEKEVWEACNTLLSASEKLTYKAIGDKLVEMGYCRGSNSDICRYLLTWRQVKGISEDDSPQISLLAASDHTGGRDIWTLLEQIQNHLRQLDSKYDTLSKPAQAAPVEQTSHQRDWLKGDIGLFATKSDMEELSNSQAKAFVRLFEHHEMMFDKYLSSLDSLRQVNNKLTEQLSDRASKLKVLEQQLSGSIELAES